MKKLSVLLIALLVVGFWACEDDVEERPEISLQELPVLDAPFSTSYILSPENPNALVETFTWDEARYTENVVPQYTLELALADTGFEPYEILGNTTDNRLPVTVETLNNAAITLGALPFSDNLMEIRLRVNLGTMAPGYAEDIYTVTVRPYTTDLPRIAAPGDHQGWDPATGPQLAASAYGATDYEGFMWLNTEFKFVGPDAAGQFQWGNTDWGDASGVNGSYTEVLAVDGEGNIGPPDGPGYYYVQADTGELTYSAVLMNYGIIGDATPGGWTDDTDLIYDAATQTLYIDIDLAPGEFKFRVNDAWHGGTFPYEIGPANAEGFLDSGGGNIVFDGAAGNYRVVLDLSNPREYTYSITPN